jgi:type I restriction enzyme S subunit
VIAELAKYERCKSTGLKWLGEIPSHWELNSLRNLTQSRSERNRPELPLLSVERERGVIVRDREKASNHNFIPDDLTNYKVAKQGDLVINKMKAWQGSMGIAPCDGIVSPAYYVFRFRFADRAFAHRLLRSQPYVAHFAAASDGVRIGQWDLSIPGMRNIPIIVPPADEQELIVRFLDWASVRLGKAIAAKRKVIGLLEEQKQAIIHRAVTRGLDDSVPLKPSGIPWLGDIPTHWEVRRTKAVAHIKTGGRDTAHRVDMGLYPFFVRSQTVERINSFSFDGEAVLTAGDGAGVAKVFHYIDGKFDYHQRVYRFSDFRLVSGRFFFFYLGATLRYEALDASAKSTVDSLRLPLLQCFPCVIPLMREQGEIVAFAEQETLTCDKTISRLNCEIELLREYRTRLISDVVTGKLDVREFARTLPADVAEEAAELASSELGDELSDTDDELDDELAGEPA